MHTATKPTAETKPADTVHDPHHVQPQDPATSATSVRLPDAWAPPAEPTPEAMAREAGYDPNSAMGRAFCVGIDAERLRSRMGTR